MPKWTPEAERQLLVLYVTQAGITPSMDIAGKVAAVMGDSLTASAISYAMLAVQCSHHSESSANITFLQTEVLQVEEGGPEPTQPIW